MMHDINTRIFLDSGDPSETEKTISLGVSLAGQTTNPTLIAKNPEAQRRLKEGGSFSKTEILELYRTIVEAISDLLPQGSVSIEVPADANTTAREMVQQATNMFTWIPNAHIKLPITHTGLAAAEELIKEGVRVNMTLCFSLSQAAAVYAATLGAQKGQVFISPFVGRLDDTGTNGMMLIEHIRSLYANGDGHVDVLAASIRSREHLINALHIGTDIVTVPYALLSTLHPNDFHVSNAESVYDTSHLVAIPYQSFDLEEPWSSFDITHPLTDKGLERFSSDWNSLLTHI